MSFHGQFRTDDNGRYYFYYSRPTPYPIPSDGPVSKLLRLLDRHEFRPGHVHFKITAPRHRELITQLFDGRDSYVSRDTVFAVREELVEDFKPRKGDAKAKLVARVQLYA